MHRAIPLSVLVLLFTCLTARAGDSAQNAAGAITLDPIRGAVDDPTLLEGHVVYLDFWALWCVPCRTSFPWMQRMAESLGAEGLRVVTVNLDRKPEAADRFLEELGSTLPVIRDPEGRLATRFALQTMPTAFLFDRTGAPRLRHEGFREKESEELETLIAELLAERAPAGPESTPIARTAPETASETASETAPPTAPPTASETTQTTTETMP